MKFLGNLLWLVCGGAVLSPGWAVAGLLWCVTVVGIPVGLQCFKFAGLAFWPMGRDVNFSGGVVSLLLNVLWLVFGGFELAVTAAVFGLILCVTVVGIPFGLQHFKFAKLALMPFGAGVVRR